MNNSALTKAEIIDRIVKEHERLIFNAGHVQTAVEKEIYTDRISTIEALMKVLEIHEC